MNQGYTLLTIDDEEPIRRSVRAYFEDAGFRIQEAATGAEGLRLFRRSRPSVALVDLRMPDMSGLEIIESLAKEAPEVPLVVLSGTGFIEDAIEAIRKGAWDYVTKPILNMAELEHVVESVLEKARLRQESKRYHEHLEEEVARRNKELRESEEKYRELVENMNDVVFALDTKGLITYVSPVSESFAGYRAGDLIGHPFQEFIASQHRTEVQEKFLEALKGSPMEYEFMILKESGEPQWVRASSRPVWKGDYIAGIQGILTDITERKNADLQLETKAGELAALNRLGRDIGAELRVATAVKTAMENALRAVGPDFVVLYLKKGDSLMLQGFLPKEGPYGEGEVPVHRVGECLCGLAVKEEKTFYSKDIHKDVRCTLDDCKRAGFRSFAALPLSGAGDVIGVLGLGSYSVRDFEEHDSFLEAMANEIAIGMRNAILYEKAQTDAIELHARLQQIAEAEKEKEELTRQLYQAQKLEAIGTLAGGIAHDFNNILAPIIMGAELALMTTPVENQAHPMMQKVLTAGMRAKDLVQQILAFSRQNDLEKRPLRLQPLIKETIKLARASLPATIEIRQNVKAREDLVLANPTQVHQVMMNLFANAGHAMRENGGILEVSLKNEVVEGEKAANLPGHKAGHFAELIVSDTGHGMDQGTLEQIFDPFFTTKERGEGTGLGLSIVHGIIKSYGGDITVKSQPGQGTCFTIRIPLAEAEKEVEAPVAAPLPLGKERILFVDDEPFIGELSREILERLGYRVDTRTDPREALELFRRDPGRYDLVITDMTMPKLTGDRLALELLRIRPELPVLLCTGFSERITEAEALHLGIKGFIMKPIALAEIARKIREALGDEKTTDALSA